MNELQGSVNLQKFFYNILFQYVYFSKEKFHNI